MSLVFNAKSVRSHDLEREDRSYPQGTRIEVLVNCVMQITHCHNDKAQSFRKSARLSRTRSPSGPVSDLPRSNDPSRCEINAPSSRAKKDRALTETLPGPLMWVDEPGYGDLLTRPTQYSVQ